MPVRIITKKTNVPFYIRWAPPPNLVATYSRILLTVGGSAEREIIRVISPTPQEALVPVGMSLVEETDGTLVILFSRASLNAPILCYESRDFGDTWTVRP
jgi:hypothetical protein